MRAAFATLALFTLFTCTAAQSPIVTTSTSDVLSDDFQDDDLSEISVPENDDLGTPFDDSTQFSDGSETSASGIQTDLSTDDFASQVSPTPADSSSSTTGAAAPPTTTDVDVDAATPSPVTTTTTTTTTPVASNTPPPTAPTPTSSEETAADATATPVPSGAAVEDEEAASPTPATGDASASPVPSTVPSTESPASAATNTASGAAGLWVDSRAAVSTAAVGALGVIALRFGVFAGEL